MVGVTERTWAEVTTTDGKKTSRPVSRHNDGDYPSRFPWLKKLITEQEQELFKCSTDRKWLFTFILYEGGLP